MVLIDSRLRQKTVALSSDGRIQVIESAESPMFEGLSRILVPQDREDALQRLVEDARLMLEDN